MYRLTEPITAGTSKTYGSIFVGDEIPKRREAATKAPPAIVSLLASFGITPPIGCRYKVETIDTHMRARNATIDQRLMVKSALRQINGLE